MASLSELVAAADYTQRGREAADPVYSGAQAFAGGLTKGADFSQSGTNKRLEMVTKLLALKEKMSEIKQKQDNQAMMKKILQSQGLLPLDPEDQNVARSAANGIIGTEGVDPAKGTKTDAGKLVALVNTANLNGGLEFDPAGSINQGKPQFKNAKTYNEPAERMRTRSLASQMAKQSYAEQVKKNFQGDQFGLESPESLIQKYQPTMEDIARFEPTAREYLYGKRTATPAAPAKKATKAADPLDKVGDLGDVSSLWDLLK